MTGYAQARKQSGDWSLRVSVKSVNHRFLDLKLQIPEGFDPYETRIRQLVREHILRGHLYVVVNFEAENAAGVQVNLPLVEAYLEAAEELRQKTKAATGMDVVGLLRLPGVIKGAGPAVPESEEERENLWQTVHACLEEALANLREMRRAEGAHLVENLRERISTIAGLCAKIRTLAESLRPAFARRLDLRLKELLGGAGIDPARLAQEAALLVERSDITEELERLQSHLQQFTKLLDGAGEVGKKLDFLLQEMQREANTMLSKTPGVESEALAITGSALEIKSEIEKLREQVQNIE
ncbi:MAG TPA: YicC/YloC family endoribonuclease [Candidatus Dormibacteraeota bacterium]|nr:YicC/YloC family endoribonuclease [Candidatus Dormibacteraeota bacterium]